MGALADDGRDGVDEGGEMGAAAGPSQAPLTARVKPRATDSPTRLCSGSSASVQIV